MNYLKGKLSSFSVKPSKLLKGTPKGDNLHTVLGIL